MNDQQRAAMQMALEAFELHAAQYPHMVKGYCIDAIAALREALAQPQGEPVAFLAEATRFKVCMTDHECMITGLPMELGGRWVALVSAEDDCHLQYAAPPSVEAAIEATKEKAAQICDDKHDYMCSRAAEAIRSMK